MREQKVRELLSYHYDGLKKSMGILGVDLRTDIAQVRNLLFDLLKYLNLQIQYNEKYTIIKKKD